MASESKPDVSKENTFDLLDIRLGRVTEAVIEPSAPKKAYVLTVDFGKHGVRKSVGRFTQHSSEDLIGKLVLGILNFGPRQIGDVVSEVLILGVQFPKADSGEATPIVPLKENVKLGGKLF